jgi:GNAT superfamily N-acetyltransferase
MEYDPPAMAMAFADMNIVTPLRQNGIGTRMIKAAEQLVRQAGRGAIGIGVNVEPDYAIAQALYPKLGYISDGTGVHRDQWGGCTYSTKVLTEEADRRAW